MKLIKPSVGKVTLSIVQDALSLIGETWPIHKGLRQRHMDEAYDYAIREHLAAAENGTKRVPRPKWLVAD